MSPDKKAHWKQKLAQSRMQLRTLLMSLSEEQWKMPIYSEENTWTAADIAAHLIDTERGMSIQIHKTRQGKETVPEGFDVDKWNAGLSKRMGSLTPQELLQGLAQTRAKTLEVMDTLTGEDWNKVGRHPSQGMITIEQYYETIAKHETLHAEDIRGKVKDEAVGL